MICALDTSYLHDDVVFNVQMRRDYRGAVWRFDIVNSDTGQYLILDWSTSAHTEAAFAMVDDTWHRLIEQGGLS